MFTKRTLVVARKGIPPKQALAAMMLGSLWDCFWIVLGLFWDHVGIVLGSCWDKFGIIVGSFWDHVEIIVGSRWDNFGIMLG